MKFACSQIPGTPPSLSQVVGDIFGRRRKFHRREKFRRRETNFEIETLNSSSECYSTPLMGPAHQY